MAQRRKISFTEMQLKFYLVLRIRVDSSAEKDWEAQRRAEFHEPEFRSALKIATAFSADQAIIDGNRDEILNYLDRETGEFSKQFTNGVFLPSSDAITQMTRGAIDGFITNDINLANEGAEFKETGGFESLRDFAEKYVFDTNTNMLSDFTEIVIPVVKLGTLEPDNISGSAAADDISSSDGDDKVTGAGGNDIVNGGAGIDTSKYSGNLSDYSVTKSGSNYLVIDNRSGSPEGTDTLVNVEKLQFADQTVDIDAGVTFTSSVETLFSNYEDAAKGLSAAYGVLLDGVPNQAGFKFLIGNAAVTNFGAGDGPVFNQENIFINLVNNLVQGNPAAKAKFNTLATGDTLEAKIAALYKAVIPVSNQTTDGLNFFTRPEGIKFFEDAAAERGIAGAEGAAVAALAAMLKIVVTEDIGIGNSVNDLIKAIAAGSSGVPETSSALIPLETADGTAFDGDEASTARLAFEAPATHNEVPLIQTVGTIDDPFAMV